jgi:hypothetical protein
MNSQTNPNSSRGVLTLAYGDARFLEQARSLAHSLQLHAPDLPRTLVTDSTDPELHRQFTQVVAYRKEYGSGVRQKLFLDHYSPYEQTLFIDSDCLVLGNLDAFWIAFTGQHFGVPGFRYLQKGASDPYLDVDYVLTAFNLTAIPKFNGGTYYFTRSPEAAKFFDTARNVLSNFRELRLGEFRRNGPNDEAVYAIAMAIHHIRPTFMRPGGMWTPCGYKGPLVLDAIAGNCSFEKEGMRLSPEIVHFPGEYMYAFPYFRERARLKARVEGKKTPAVAFAKPFATSLLWQCSRRSQGLATLARTSLRLARAVRSYRTVNAVAKTEDAK